MTKSKLLSLIFVYLFFINIFANAQSRPPQPDEYLGLIRISSYCVTDSVNISSEFLKTFVENNPERKNEAETSIILIGMAGLNYATQVSTYVNRYNFPPAAFRELCELAIELIQIIIGVLSEKEADYSYINHLNNHVTTINTVLAAFNF